MIFHPLVWRGIPLRVMDGQPLGLFGWQGIVPAKAGVMAERMVDMVTTQLVDVEQVSHDMYMMIMIMMCANHVFCPLFLPILPPVHGVHTPSRDAKG